MSTGEREFTANPWYVIPALAVFLALIVGVIGYIVTGGDWNAVIVGSGYVLFVFGGMAMLGGLLYWLGGS